MFNVLIIDDQAFKMNDIKNHISKSKAKTTCSSDSFTAKKLLKILHYDLIVLDITLRESFSKNDFVGIDILDYLDDEEIESPVIALTQFYDFNDLSKSSNEKGFHMQNAYYKKQPDYNIPDDLDLHELPNLHKFLSQNYINYFGCILYIQNDIVWVECLKKMMYKLGGNEYESIIDR